MKDAGASASDHHRMQVWAGQSAAMAQARPAGELLAEMWRDARHLLRSSSA
jgi:nitronate monooxygenase